jgi:glyoxylase-like metal-dependent hydrolase (beta-lactamase superfamily II)
MIVDPHLEQLDRYIALTTERGMRVHYVAETHTHADHFSATQQLAQRFGVPAVMHSASPAPFVELRLRSGELLRVGQLRLQALHTPGHTRDSMCHRRGPRLHRRHAADRRNRPHGPAQRRRRGAL